MGERLAGNVAVVTGAGQGVERGIAKAFAAEGASIAALDIDVAAAHASADDCAGRGVDAVGFGCDVADRGQVDATVANVVGRFGRIDILVTSALGKVEVRPLEDTTPQALETMWRVGYVGVVNMMQATLPHLRRHQGNVINFGSGAG